MAKQETQSLFEESSQGAVGAVTAVLVVVTVLLAFGGIVVMSYAFSLLSGVAALWLFSGGLLASIVGFMLPFAALPATGK